MLTKKQMKNPVLEPYTINHIEVLTEEEAVEVAVVTETDTQEAGGATH